MVSTITRIRPHGHVLKVGVPPGVGDVYWALTKLQALKARFRAKSVRIMVQRTSLTRALDWSRMVSFVDSSMEHGFMPDADCKSIGYSTNYGGMSVCLWPNGVIDKGGHIDEWMPELGQADLSFEIRYSKPTSGIPAVIYASSEGIHRAWTPNMTQDYWRELIDALTKKTGQRPMLIGKEWDKSFSDAIGARAINLIGKTTLPQVTGILAHARVLVGVISGMTILANHFRTPCVAIHPTIPMNPRAWVAPDAPYVPVPAQENKTPEELADIAASIARLS